jgi:hypothetical protein
MSRRWAGLPLVALVAGCSLVTGSDGELEVRTSKTSYHVGEAVTVRIVNGFDEAVYVGHCNHRTSLLLERREGESWTQHSQVNGICLAIYPSGEVRIDAGGDLSETIVVGEPGEYRLRLYARRAPEDFGSLTVLSPPFTVRYPPD